jgi:plasmid stability protein
MIMAQLVVPDIDDDVIERLRRRARKHGCTLEELVHDILRDAAKDEKPSGGLGSEIAARFRDIGFEEGEIRALRGYRVQPAKFDE